MAKIKKLKNPETGQTEYPVTVAKAVFLSDGSKTVEEDLTQLGLEVDDVAQECKKIRLKNIDGDGYYICNEDGDAIMRIDKLDTKNGVGSNLEETIQEIANDKADDGFDTIEADEIGTNLTAKIVDLIKNNAELLVDVAEDGFYICNNAGEAIAKYTDEQWVFLGLEQGQTTETVDISLPDKLYAVVGDTLQVFYRGIIKAVDPYKYDILVTCSKGKKYPRYFEYTPTSEDVGATNFKITIKDNNGNVLKSKTASLVTSSKKSSPTTSKKILCFGDSLTQNGVWCAEAYRRLTASDGTPTGEGLANIDFCGMKQINGAGFFGVGGWSWKSYTTAGSPAFRFQVSGVNTIVAGAVYTNNGNSYTIVENNTTSGSGNILCSVSSSSKTPEASGTLTKSSGDGDATISFSSAALDSQNPLWDYTNSKIDFASYANKYSGGKIDAVYTLLSWNDHTPRRTDFSSVIAEIKKFADALHADFPSAKLKLLGIQVPCVNGGLGANYGATGTGYADQYGMVLTALNQNEAFQEFANSASYSSFVEFVNVSSQFDSENNMFLTQKDVNTRNSTKENIGTNGVHPTKNGQYQIADVVYRNLVSTIL